MKSEALSLFEIIFEIVRILAPFIAGYIVGRLHVNLAAKRNRDLAIELREIDKHQNSISERKKFYEQLVEVSDGHDEQFQKLTLKIISLYSTDQNKELHEFVLKMQKLQANRDNSDRARTEPTEIEGEFYELDRFDQVKLEILKYVAESAEISFDHRSLKFVTKWRKRLR